MRTQQTQSNTVPAPVFALWREVAELDLSTRDIVEQMLAEETDFEIDSYRFIRKGYIDDILEEELGSDEYTLGCFNAWFLADVLDIDLDVIEAMQKAEAFEAIGKLVVSMNRLSDLAKAYASADGYGHHFSSYDHSEQEIGEYYVFRN